MFALRDIDHIVLRVHDMDRMIAFYRDIIGCAVEGGRPDRSLMHLRAGASIIDLMQADAVAGGPSPAHNLDHFCLNVENFDPEAATTALREQGVEVEGRTSRRTLFLLDPEGNRVELR